MAEFKVTFIFKGPSVGWSETLYRADQTQADCIAAAKVLAGKRSNMLAGNGESFIRSVRTKRLDTPFESVLTRLNIPGQGLAGGGRPDMPWIGALVHMRTASGYSRSPILLGILDVATEGPFDEIPENGGLRQAFLDWRATVIAAGWSLRVAGRNVSVPVSIDNIAVDASGRIVVTKAGHGIQVGQYITWYRVRARGACLRGRRQVIAVTANTFTVAGYNLSEITFLDGYFKQPVMILDQIRTVFAGPARRRKPGRPFGLLRGRRSKRHCR